MCAQEGQKRDGRNFELLLQQNNKRSRKNIKCKQFYL